MQHKKLGLEMLEDRRMLSTIFSEPLDSDPGWTTSGQWAFGHPTGGGGSSGGGGAHGKPDPSDGYTGLNVYGVNLAGNYSPTGGNTYYVTTTAINCANFTNVTLNFARVLNTDCQTCAFATIEVSNNGTTWNNVYANPSDPDVVADSTWQLMHYNIGLYANNQATVYIRWGYKVASNAYLFSGWNIDDITLKGDPSVRTASWDGGGGDNKWSTAANWAGDMAPAAGDHLVFPAGAAQLENSNDFPADIRFGSIIVSGGNYHILNNAVKSATLEVQGDATLSTNSIVCDTLSIGSFSTTAVAGVSDATVPSAIEQQSMRSAFQMTTALENAATTSAAIGSADVAERLLASELKLEFMPEFPAVANPFAAEHQSPALDAIADSSQMLPDSLIATIARESQQTEQRNGEKLLLQPLLERPFTWVSDAVFCIAARSDVFPTKPSELTDLLRDSIPGKQIEFSAKTKAHLSARLVEGQSIHNLAIQSLMQEFHNFSAMEQEETGLLARKRFGKQDEPPAKGVDDSILHLVAAMD